VNSTAPVLNAELQESQIEKQPCGECGEVNIAFAAHFLGISPEEVIQLCKAGMLLARRNRHGSWKIDEVFLTRWRESHTNTGAARCESNEREDQSALASPAGLPELAVRPSSCPPGGCGAHWVRRARFVPEFRLGLCRACFRGRPLSAKED
jgi:hypothetical protein